MIERLSKALRASFQDPAVAKRLTDMGVVIPAEGALKPEALGERTSREIKRWGEVISTAGIKAE